MLGRLFRIQGRTATYNRAHRIAASFLIGTTCVALCGLGHQLYKAKTEYLPDIRRRGKERLEAALALRQTEAELLEQQQSENKNQDSKIEKNQNEDEHGASASNEDVTFDYPPIKYEYLDNTADIQIHSWGDSIEESFEQAAMGMFAYMTDTDLIENRDMKQIDIRADGDLQNLLFKFLCEWLEVYGTEDYFIPRKIEINLFDRNELRIIARGYGELFDLSRHTQGTEVKAITYSNMQIHEEASTHDVYVIVDI
ncbi:unnamed protein product [Rotaria socialis]|uniref:Archease domain-containing protein n=1 Tax=Rotaria socialis TaxID=392032 RepID=A0A818ZZF5_9BILA|nr:unnamed protein product [Rotaria socialis]CAF3777216.1 unnamed protein product [Rotaria socialis]